MKEPIVNQQDLPATKQHECSEKACATCFENRGCMFGEYAFAVIHNIGESYTEQQQNEGKNSPIRKQAEIHSISHAMQKALTA